MERYLQNLLNTFQKYFEEASIDGITVHETVCFMQSVLPKGRLLSALVVQSVCLSEDT